jgi:hypothetical protein
MNLSQLKPGDKVVLERSDRQPQLRTIRAIHNGLIDIGTGPLLELHDYISGLGTGRNSDGRIRPALSNGPAITAPPVNGAVIAVREQAAQKTEVRKKKHGVDETYLLIAERLRSQWASDLWELLGLDQLLIIESWLKYVEDTRSKAVAAAKVNNPRTNRVEEHHPVGWEYADEE